MADNDDVLVGLRFEVSGGLGRMSGRIVGKAGGLYLVQKQGAEHLELLELDDLRSAKFYREKPDEPVAEIIVAPPPALAPAPMVAAEAEITAADPSGDPPRRRLADQIRKQLGGT